MTKNRKLRGGIMNMGRIRELLRLSEVGYSQRALVELTGIARTTLQGYLWKAKELEIGYEESKRLTDSELQNAFDKKRPGRHRIDSRKVQGISSTECTAIDFAKVHHELYRHKGVTLELLWNEWKLKDQGKYTYYSYSTFCRRYQGHGDFK